MKVLSIIPARGGSKGIEKKNLKTIFDSFKQENEGITRKYGGSGLGLTISKEIINLYNSEIHVKSKVNVGTEFYFDLNFQNAKEENTISKPKSKQYDLSNLNVLIVEDNQINQIYAESVIRSFKANSKVAENGKVAIDILKEYNFSIVLMDMQMPVMDGIETTKWIREKLNSKIPIIGLSANTVQGDIDLCTEVGMNSYLSKPFTPKALNEAIGKVLSLDEIPEINERKVNKSVAKNKKFDLDTLLQHTNNNQVLINKMLEIFISETPIELSKIKSSFIENNYKDLAEIAHKIKPNFKYLGIEIGFELALKLEKNNGDKEVISNNIKQLDKLTKEILPLLKKEIKNK